MKELTQHIEEALKIGKNSKFVKNNDELRKMIDTTLYKGVKTGQWQKIQPMRIFYNYVDGIREPVMDVFNRHDSSVFMTPVEFDSDDKIKRTYTTLLQYMISHKDKYNFVVAHTDRDYSTFMIEFKDMTFCITGPNKLTQWDVEGYMITQGIY